jgi:2,3,4,5-tetrahydropyridine-2-carboxylate N-succinyltransferase
VLEVPAGAVVVPGSRKLRGSFAEENGLSIATPVIVKYRDASTDARTSLEQALRP